MEFHAVETALHTTINRAVTAGKSGNLNARKRQVLAAIKYTKLMSSIVSSKFVPDQNALARQVRRVSARAASLFLEPAASELKYAARLLNIAKNPAPAAFPKGGLFP